MRATVETRSTVSALNSMYTDLVAQQGASWCPLSGARTLQICSPATPPPSCLVFVVNHASFYSHLCHPWVFLSRSLCSSPFQPFQSYLYADSTVCMSHRVLSAQILNPLTSSVPSILPYVSILAGRGAGGWKLRGGA